MGLGKRANQVGRFSAMILMPGPTPLAAHHVNTQHFELALPGWGTTGLDHRLRAGQKVSGPQDAHPYPLQVSKCGKACPSAPPLLFPQLVTPVC